MYRNDPYDKSIVIDGFEQGIADSPFNGIADMRNVNIISIPGEVSVGFSTTKDSLSTVSALVASADAGTDTITASSVTGTLQNGQALTFSGAGLPGGISTSSTYWIGGLSGSNFKIYDDPSITTLRDITSNGTGSFLSINMGKPLYKTYDNVNDRYYVIDANGRVWGNGIGPTEFVFLNNTLNAPFSNGNGLVYYRGYIFAFQDNKIDYMNANTFAWTYGWQTLNTAAGTNNSHQALTGQDDTVYYCDGSYLGSFFQKSGTTFDPANAATYTWAQKALALPSIDTAVCLEELGVNLLTGGKLNKIYPWNRISTSFTYPILLPENYTTRMVTVNNSTYVFAGNRGRIYVTNGSQAQLFKKVPDHISNTVEPYFQWGDATFLKNQLYFGISAKSNAGTAISQYGGLWAIDLSTGALRLSTELSFGTYAGLASVILPIYSNPGTGASGLGMYIGWDSGASTYGMDVTSSNPYTGSQAIIDTDLIPIGTKLMPRNFTQVEYKLTKPLVSGESITIQYRTDFSQTFSTIFSDNTAGNFSGISPSINFKNAQWIQLRAILNSTTSSPSYVRLKELRLRR